MFLELKQFNFDFMCSTYFRYEHFVENTLENVSWFFIHTFIHKHIYLHSPFSLICLCEILYAVDLQHNTYDLSSTYDSLLYDTFCKSFGAIFQ